MQTKYILPNKLEKGDKIGIIAPSFPTANWFSNRFDFALKAIPTHLQLEYELANSATSAKGFVSDDAKKIAEEIHSFIKNPSIKAIFTTIGGFNSAEILPFLDADLIRNNPKIFIGFSDTTALLLGINALSELVTFYGPAIMTQMGEYPKPFDYTLQSLNKTLFSGNAVGNIEDPAFWTNEFVDWGGNEWNTRPRKTEITSIREIWKHGKGEGTLFGGNIETLNFLIGTKYFQPPKDIVFFWEATEAEAFLPRVQRAFTHLKQCGFFENVKAMLIGRSPDCKTMSKITLQDCVIKYFEDFNFPIIANLAFGHTDPILTVPIGTLAKVETFEKNNSATISILETATKN
jgi:muramoyltetrapeptide carboxypeptidase